MREELGFWGVINENSYAWSEWVIDVLLLYSIANYIKSLIWNKMEDNVKKKACIYIEVWFALLSEKCSTLNQL